MSDVPLGAFLSGGLDSTIIVGLMARLLKRPVRSFTLVARDSPVEDSRYGAAVAEYFGTDHAQIEVHEDELLGRVQEALEKQDRPSADGVNTYLVASAARDSGLTVALSGVGADELFGGYPSFRHVQRLRRLRWVWDHVPRAARVALADAGVAALPSSEMHKLRDVMASDGSVEGLVASLRSVFGQTQVSALLRDGAPEQSHAAGGPRLDVDPSAVQGPLTRTSRAELTGYMRDVLLRDADQMGMAASLEIRVPFLDQGVVTRSLALGERARRPSKPPKHFLAEAFSDLVPEFVSERPKEGFRLPFARWMRGPLRDLCRDAISNVAEHRAFSESAVRGIWSGFLQGQRRLSWSRPWLLVALGTWLRRHAVE